MAMPSCAKACWGRIRRGLPLRVLILDAPTNHPAPPSLECIESPLAECRAALVLVSHDPAFRHRLCTRHWRLDVAPDGHVELRESALGAD